MRILHTADVHLDAAFASHSDDLRRKLRDASRTAFTRLVDRALEERVDAVVIAGDLFDGERLSFQTERVLLTELARLTGAGITVVYATGNHDPGETGRRTLDLPWPSGVHVASGRAPLEVTVTNDRGDALGTVAAVGHAGPRETDDLSPLFPVPEGDAPRVAVLHTQVHEAGGSRLHDAYAPSRLDHLRAAGYHYWALGHVHRRQELCAEPAIHYPGNLQGRTPAEGGAKGALLAEVRRGRPADVTFLSLAPIRWEDLSVGDLRDATTLDGLVASVRDAWEEVRAESPEDAGVEWIVRVDLAGSTPLWRELGSEDDQEQLREEIERTLGVLSVTLRVGEVHAPVSPADHVERVDVLGEALRLIGSVRDGADSLSIVPAELASAPADHEVEAYVRELLEGAEEELLARMLRSVGEGR